MMNVRPLLLVLAAVSATGGLQAERLKPLCLQPSDVPRGYRLTVSQPYTNEMLAKVLRMPIKRVAQGLNRVAGYRTQYQASGGRSIGVVVSEFRTEAGARQFDVLNTHIAVTYTWFGALSKKVPIVRVGTATTALVIRFTYYGVHYTGVKILFRRGTLEAIISAQVPGTAAPLDSTIALARVIDSRFARAHV